MYRSGVKARGMFIRCLGYSWVRLELVVEVMSAIIFIIGINKFHQQRTG